MKPTSRLYFVTAQGDEIYRFGGGNRDKLIKKVLKFLCTLGIMMKDGKPFRSDQGGIGFKVFPMVFGQGKISSYVVLENSFCQLCGEDDWLIEGFWLVHALRQLSGRCLQNRLLEWERKSIELVQQSNFSQVVECSQEILLDEEVEELLQPFEYLVSGALSILENPSFNIISTLSAPLLSTQMCFGSPFLYSYHWSTGESGQLIELACSCFDNIEMSEMVIGFNGGNENFQLALKSEYDVLSQELRIGSRRDPEEMLTLLSRRSVSESSVVSLVSSDKLRGNSIVEGVSPWLFSALFLMVSLPLLDHSWFEKVDQGSPPFLQSLLFLQPVFLPNNAAGDVAKFGAGDSNNATARMSEETDPPSWFNTTKADQLPVALAEAWQQTIYRLHRLFNFRWVFSSGVDDAARGVWLTSEVLQQMFGGSSFNDKLSNSLTPHAPNAPKKSTVSRPGRRNVAAEV